VRSLILKKVFHAEAIIYQAGVSHNDTFPRNIMLLGSNYEDGVATKDVDVEVKVIDFNIAEVHKHPRSSRWESCDDPVAESNKYPKLSSPIVRFHGRMMDFSCKGWYSNEKWDAEKWLFKHFHKDTRYTPIVFNGRQSGRRPQHQKPEGAESDSD
jgi:hypothetical protein